MGICLTVFLSCTAITLFRQLYMLYKYKYVTLCKALDINDSSVSVMYTYASGYPGYRSGYTGEVKNTGLDVTTIGNEIYTYVNRNNSSDLMGYNYVEEVRDHAWNSVIVIALGLMRCIFLGFIERM